jgi:hypothetical protein
VRTFRIAVTLTTLLASAPPIHAEHPQPQPIQTSRLEQQLLEAKYARIGVGGRTYVLVKPVVTPDGLAYRSVEGYPKRRPAIVAGADWDSVATPSNPVPWSTIDRIESGHVSRRPGAVIGAFLGLLTGFGWGYGVASLGDDPGQSPWQIAIGAGAVFAVAGAGIGALFTSTHWQQVYPEGKGSAGR